MLLLFFTVIFEVFLVLLGKYNHLFLVFKVDGG